MDQQLQHIERVVGKGKVGRDQARAAYRQEIARLDPPHPGASTWHARKAGKPAPTAGVDDPRSPPVLAALTWTALSLGTMTFVCGGILLGWALVTGRGELWSVGMPVALCGQIALLVGLILQLDRLWHNSRQAAAKLDAVDRQIHQLKTATSMLGTGHGSPAGAFYCHLVEGAGPELLLSDLKGQLDLLALKLGQEGR